MGTLDIDYRGVPAEYNIRFTVVAADLGRQVTPKPRRQLPSLVSLRSKDRDLERANNRSSEPLRAHAGKAPRAYRVLIVRVAGGIRETIIVYLIGE
jgi:hypothetical protein